MSKLDAVYRSILITKFFTKGWGKPENLQRLFEFRKVVSDREECLKLIDRDYPVTITKEQNLSDCRVLDGYFTTPLEHYLPGIVPEVAQKAHFQVVLPLKWPDPNCKPMCLHLAGTGDHFFWRRRNLMVRPLLKEAGIGGIILENPFYGLRKPTDQVRSSLHNVSDIFVMGGCLMLESLVLFHWCERNGLGPLGVTGLSMGGHMASLAATNWPKPLVLVPCLSWATASAVFLQGVMSQSINWDLLEDQYLSDGIYREKLSKMVTVVDEAFLAGKKFARSMSHSAIYREDSAKRKGNLDIIYKEEREKIPSESDLFNFNDELKRLYKEGKISLSLYEKLVGNENFQLEARDIEELNNINEKDIKTRVAIKFKINNLNELKDIEPMRDSTNTYSNSTVNLIQNIQHLQNVAAQNNNLVKENQRENILNNFGVNDTDACAKEIAKTAECVSETENIAINEPIKCGNENANDCLNKEQELKSGNDIDNSNLNKESTTVKCGNDMDSSHLNKEQFKSGNDIDKSSLNKEKEIKSRNDNGKEKLNDKKQWIVTEFTTDLWSSLPFIKQKSEKKIDINKIHWRDREALQFMRGIMDECTHLTNFSTPYDTSLIIAVCAIHDAYVPREDVGRLEEIWPGAEVRYVDAGHVSAYLLHQSMFRSCIIEAFDRSKKRWKDGRHIDL